MRRLTSVAPFVCLQYNELKSSAVDLMLEKAQYLKRNTGENLNILHYE